MSPSWPGRSFADTMGKHKASPAAGRVIIFSKSSGREARIIARYKNAGLSQTCSCQRQRILVLWYGPFTGPICAQTTSKYKPPVGALVLVFMWRVSGARCWGSRGISSLIESGSWRGVASESASVFLASILKTKLPLNTSIPVSVGGLGRPR